MLTINPFRSGSNRFSRGLNCFKGNTPGTTRVLKQLQRKHARQANKELLREAQGLLASEEDDVVDELVTALPPVPLYHGLHHRLRRSS